MTLEYRCSNCGTLLQTTNADPLDSEIERMQAALTKIAEDNYQPEDWRNEPGMVWQQVARRALEQKATKSEG